MPIDFGALLGTLVGARPDLTTAISGGQFQPSQAAIPATLQQQLDQTNSPFHQQLQAIVGQGDQQDQPQTQPRPATPASYTPIQMSPAQQRWDAIFGGGRMADNMAQANIQGGQMVGQNVLGKDQAGAQNLLNLALQRNVTPQDSAALEPGYRGVAQSGQQTQMGSNQAAQAEALYRAKMAGGMIPQASEVGSSEANRHIWENVAGGTTAQNVAQTEKAIQPQRLQNTMQQNKLIGQQIGNQLELTPMQQVLARNIARMGANYAPNIAANSFPVSPNRVNPATGASMPNAANIMQYLMAGQKAYSTAAGAEQGRIDAALSLGNQASGTNAGAPSYRPPTTASPGLSPNGYPAPIGTLPNGMPIYPPQQ
jgi:hypothetical protein